MSNCACCSVIVKEKDAVNELLEVLGKNFDASSGEYFLSLEFYDKKYDWHYTAFSVVKIENRAEYIRYETEFRCFDALCTYLKFKGIDFIYEFTDENHGMGGLTNDMAGEFFTTCLCVVFDDMDDEVTVDIPIDATDEYIESKINNSIYIIICIISLPNDADNLFATDYKVPCLPLLFYPSYKMQQREFAFVFDINNKYHSFVGECL